ncbi:MAG: hypothetical protein AAF869_10100 [Pseudomonadota bacterium]
MLHLEKLSAPAARRLPVWLIAGASVLALAACGGEDPSSEETAAPEITETGDAAALEAAPADQEADAPAAGVSLDDILAGEWRAEDSARDGSRNPGETLAFFGLEPGMTVIEVWPGGGWYTNILAPYLAQTEGQYIAAGFDPAAPSEYVQRNLKRFQETYVDRPDLYGAIETAALSAESGPLAAPGSADMALTFRNVHNWMTNDFAEKAFADFFAALKPGGVLGVVEHRAAEGAEFDPKARSGYVTEAFVIELAEGAGFVLEESAEINANPKDTKDHPFGVWTLPPSLRTAGYGEEADETFDTAPFEAIG